jgi:hypothetical protein
MEPDDNTAVATPPLLVAAAVPPPKEKTIAVKPVTSAVAPVQNALVVAEPKPNINDLYEKAIANNDRDGLKAIANDRSNPPEVADAAINAIRTLDRNGRLAEHLSKIDPDTGEGRVQLAATFNTLNNREEAIKKGWTTIKDSPQVGTALLQFVLGDKKGAISSITGGSIKASTEYDDYGNMLIVNRNELEQIDSIYDSTGKMLSRQEYADRGGSRPLDQTLFRDRQKKFAEEYTKIYIQDQDKQNKSSAALAAGANYSREMAKLTDEFKDLGEKELSILVGFNDSTLNVATSVNNTVQNLKQASETKGKSLSAATIKDIENKTGTVLGTVWSHIEGDTFKNDAGETASASKLASDMSTASLGKTVENSVRKAQKELAAQMRLAQTEGAPPEKIQQFAKLMRYFDLAGMREKLYVDNKDKVPSFVQLPTEMPAITDQASRMKLNAIQGEYADKQMEAFLKWKDTQLKQERTIDKNFVPEPGRYEAQWVKQPQFLELENSYQKQAEDVLSKMPVIAKSVDTKTLPTGPVPPEASAKTNEPKGAATPPNKGKLEFLEDKKQDFKPTIKRRK